jgi:hypothetical protein
MWKRVITLFVKRAMEEPDALNLTSPIRPQRYVRRWHRRITMVNSKDAA